MAKLMRIPESFLLQQCACVPCSCICDRVRVQGGTGLGLEQGSDPTGKTCSQLENGIMSSAGSQCLQEGRLVFLLYILVEGFLIGVVLSGLPPTLELAIN
jgi:hypothetical protein